MLDSATKRRIDTARDILVGKVPDPKSQVEQITIALIYKFMDDMDAEAEELGGKRKFFTGDYARYGWAKLMSPGIGGHELIGLYGEGIATMPQNPGIPALFRDMFKNAYLPYRDPETLKSFLKIIDEFQYDHSERLGDAFEYLLSVLGSQGDAGQFRTPRHIIDFMVEVLAPQKGETVLDPACGTAGFLISAYKHILRSNTDAKGNSTLTPQQKGELAKNFKGYDISPDMVRLSLVNLYLHGFTDPHIYEYDTLTSDDRWNEFADVILTNPPFMSPKGGIKPHKRFSIQAKRSEVLFVDYMAEHLTPAGRAAIIVPEGIIFQSQAAYNELRKMLVKNSLVAVISLPAGCFNPYSAVKTSILILDKCLARESDTIGFFRVENDGFGLGAQRRASHKNDIPQVQAELNAYLHALRSKAPTEKIHTLTSTAQIVSKKIIALNGENSLNGERYREQGELGHHWKTAQLSEVCTKITDGSHNPPERAPHGRLMLSSQNIFDNRLDLSSHRFVNEDDFHRENQRTRVSPGDVLLTIVGTIGRCLVVSNEMPQFMLQRSVAVFGPDHSLLQSEFLARVLQSQKLQNTLQGLAKGVAQKGVYLNELRGLQIPLPPLEVQQEIVAEIEGYQKVIDGARSVIDNYRPNIYIHPDWPMLELGEVCDVRDGTHESPKYVLEGYPLITSKNLKNGFIDFTDANLITRENLDAINRRSKVDPGDILMPMIGTIGNPVIADATREYAVKNVALIKFPKNCAVDNRFLKDVLDSAAMQARFQRHASGSTQKFIALGFIRKLTIPVPPLLTQSAIAAEIEAEQALVVGNRDLIFRLERKIEATIARVWDGAV